MKTETWKEYLEYLKSIATTRTELKSIENLLKEIK